MADFNSDGKADLVVANSGFDANVSVLLGNGDGTLQTSIDFAAGPSSISLARNP
jgi:hypothetical protein